MRAPSQLALESAPAYAVRARFTVDGIEYPPGSIVGGEWARALPTFRSLLGVHWLIPATALAPDQTYTMLPDVKLSGDEEAIATTALAHHAREDRAAQRRNKTTRRRPRA